MTDEFDDNWLVVFSNPSEKYEFVNWDDDIPNINGKIKNGNQTTNQDKFDDKLQAAFWASC